MATPRSLKAVVIGGSGAIGRCLLGELASSPTFSEVVSLGRRKIEIPDRYEIDVAKLKQEIVDFDLEKFTIENSKSYFEEKDVFFCTIGTTRSAASQQPGSTAENFRQIDLHLVTHCAQIAKSAGVRHVSLVTSQGANANSWFLYMRTKGEVENSVEKLDFDRLTVWRPGLLGRGSEARFVEKLASLLL
jgi:oxidoreductase